MSGYRTFALLAALSLAVAVSSCGRDEAPKAGKGSGAKAQASTVRARRRGRGGPASPHGHRHRDARRRRGCCRGVQGRRPGDRDPGRPGQSRAQRAVLGAPRPDRLPAPRRSRPKPPCARCARASACRRNGTDDKVDPEKTALVREAGAVLAGGAPEPGSHGAALEEGVHRAGRDTTPPVPAAGRRGAVPGRDRGDPEPRELLAERRSGLELAKQQLADTTC